MRTGGQTWAKRVSLCREAGLLKSNQDGVESSYCGKTCFRLDTRTHCLLYLSSWMGSKHTLALSVSLSYCFTMLMFHLMFNAAHDNNIPILTVCPVVKSVHTKAVIISCISCVHSLKVVSYFRATSSSTLYQFWQDDNYKKQYAFMLCITKYICDRGPQNQS